ncbi:MAG: hypothetical protein M0Q90_14330 [Bacteroidales bacterium]|nr:hypothetical protein [Bacteroidales bacterium]
MKKEHDILLNGDYDLAISGGDFAVGENLNQQLACLLIATPGDYRQSPIIGIGIQSYLLDEDKDELNRSIRLNCKRDGLQVKKLEIKNGQITIDATRAN